jgi:hephaestin
MSSSTTLRALLVTTPLILAATAVALWAFGVGRDDRAGAAEGHVRTHYIAAVERPWDYAPDARDRVHGGAFGDGARVFVARGPGRIGSVYTKALFREFTDATFSSEKPRPAAWRHLGMLGPALHAEVGDTVRVVFRNRTRRPLSIHPHGMRYDKANEGAPFADGTSGDARADDSVAPGRTHTYEWTVPERSGPGPHDPSSIMWMYMAHTDEVADQYAGLMGPIIVTRRGMARADGTPLDVDRELVANFMVVDENQSPYLAENLRRIPRGTRPGDLEDEGFVESNLMHAINGYVFGNGPGFDVTKGQRVRWYVMGMGTEVDLHSPHWHGTTVDVMGMHTDVVSLLPGTMVTADMTPDEPGVWLLHCHVNDHISAGMSSLWRVRPGPGGAAAANVHHG